MKVKMLTNTNYQRKALRMGAEVDVPDDVAQRWEARRIAEVVNPAANKGNGEKDVNLNKMTSAQLDEYAEAKGIDISAAGNKAEKLEIIQAAEQ